MSDAARKTRRQLLRAASEEIALRGYAGASMARIAARLGYTKGVFSHHFPYKSAILTELATAGERLIRYCDVRSAARAPDGGLAGVASFIEALSWATSTDVVAAAVIRVLVDGDEHDGHVSISPAPWQDALVGYLTVAIDRDGVTLPPGTSVEDSARWMMSGVAGMCLYYAEGDLPRARTWPVRPVLAMGGIVITDQL